MEWQDIVASLVFTAGGCLCFVALIYLYLKGRRSEKWPSAPGKVVSTEIKHWKDDDGDRFDPKLTYEYSVNGTTYTSSRIRPVHWICRRQEEAADMLRPYPLDRSVTVWFEPSDPTDALLEPGRLHRAEILVLLVLGLGFIAAGFTIYSICRTGTCGNEQQRRSGRPMGRALGSPLLQRSSTENTSQLGNSARNAPSLV
jgi:hypothetical protein